MDIKYFKCLFVVLFVIFYTFLILFIHISCPAAIVACQYIIHECPSCLTEGCVSLQSISKFYQTVWHYIWESSAVLLIFSSSQPHHLLWSQNPVPFSRPHLAVHRLHIVGWSLSILVAWCACLPTHERWHLSLVLTYLSIPLPPFCVTINIQHRVTIFSYMLYACRSFLLEVSIINCS